MPECSENYVSINGAKKCGMMMVDVNPQSEEEEDELMEVFRHVELGAAGETVELKLKNTPIDFGIFAFLFYTAESPIEDYPYKMGRETLQKMKALEQKYYH